MAGLSTRIVAASTKLFLSLLAGLLIALLATLARLLCLLPGFLLGPAVLATLLTALVLLGALVRSVHWNTSRGLGLNKDQRQ
jgi:hypothetical protein